MLDLDAIERHWAAVGNSACPQCQSEALLAELRAAREIIAEAQTQGHGPDSDNPNCAQCKAVTAYLKVAGKVEG